MSAPNTSQRQDPSPDIRELWGEALWGVGLMGSILLFVVLIAAVFGR